MARKRPQILKGNTTKKQTGCGPMYVTINDDDDNNSIYELFASLGKGGGCASAQVEAICRMASLALRCGATPSQVVKQLSGISCPSPVTIDGGPEETVCKKQYDETKCTNVSTYDLKVFFNSNPTDALIDLLIWVRKEADHE